MEKDKQVYNDGLDENEQRKNICVLKRKHRHKCVVEMDQDKIDQGIVEYDKPCDHSAFFNKHIFMFLRHPDLFTHHLS
jgi:hypothetical protein